MIETRCPICDIPLPPEHDGISCLCAQCGILLNVYTQELNYSSGNGQNPPDAKKSRWRLINSRRRLAIIRQHLDGHTAFADIGCGSGESLVAARDLFATSIGFEINEPLVRFGRDALGVAIEPVLFSAERLAPEIQQQKKVFASSHVLEHLADPVTFVTGIRQACSAGDLVYLEVPLHTGTSFARLGYRWSAWNSEHLALYSLPALRILAERTGFSVRESGTRVFARASHSGKTRLRLLRQRPLTFLRSLWSKSTTQSIADRMIADYGYVVLVV